MGRQNCSDFDRVTEICGAAAARAICDAFPGQRIYVPSAVQPHSKLTLAIGVELSIKLIEEMGGLYLDVPSGHAFKCADRRGRIAELVKLGKTANEIVAQVGCSRRLVASVRAGIRAGCAA